MSNSIKIILVFCFIFLIYFPTKSNHITTKHSILEESITEFEIIKFSIGTDEYEPTTTIFYFRFKVKRDDIWLPCEYNLDFYHEPKRNSNGFVVQSSCQGSNKLALEEIETKLRPEENRKVGRLLAQKIKEKGFAQAAEKALQMVNTNTKYMGCHLNMFYCEN